VDISRHAIKQQQQQEQTTCGMSDFLLPEPLKWRHWENIPVLVFKYAFYKYADFFF